MSEGLKSRFVICAAICALVSVCMAVSAQTPIAGPHFEVATVKPAVDDPNVIPVLKQAMRNARRYGRPPGSIPLVGADRVRLQNWPLLDLIAAAYSVRVTQVSGPVWLGDQAFDVEALLPDGARKEELNAMLQALLVERFGLKVHRETQTRDGYALMVGKGGPKLTPAEPQFTPGPGLTPEQQQAQLREHAEASLKRHMQENAGLQRGFSSNGWDSITLGDFALQVGRIYTQTPVVDETALPGKYAIRIETSNSPDAGEGSIFDAVQTLGLKLERRKIAVDTVVIDQVSKTPTAN